MPTDGLVLISVTFAAGAATASCRFLWRYLQAEREAKLAAEAEQERCLTRRERSFEQLTGHRPGERPTR